jgi:type II secretory pathway component GspD/PulD (secretin)
MKWSILSPSFAFAILALLSAPVLDGAGAATPQEIRPRAKPSGGPGAPSGAPARPAPPGFAVQTVPVNHRPAAELKNVLSAFVTPGGSVLEQPGGKALTIIDAPANLADVLEIKELIDTPAFAGARLEIFTPEKAGAEELAAAMTELARSYIFSVPAGESVPVELIPLPRGNHILVVARGEDAWRQARVWLERVDAWSGSPRRIFVYPLDEKQAAEVAEKLAAAKISSPRIVLDPVAGVLVFHGTAEEFQELKRALSGGRELAGFKQRLAALGQKFVSSTKTAP